MQNWITQQTRKKMQSRSLINCILLGFSYLFVSFPLQAAIYSLPDEGDYLVGNIQYIYPQSGDTLFDIARQYDLGLNEILAANPGIKPRLLNKKTRIILPTRFILPDAPWEGVIVNLAEMRLYYFPPAKPGEDKKVITHPIGIGRQGRSTPLGEYNILMKIENPNWTMPEAVHTDLLSKGIKKERVVPPGPDNPLGEFAMMLNNKGLFMHGTNNPSSIGMRVSSGCLRLYPEDILNLVNAVPKGAAVRIVEQPYKLGIENGVLFLETHGKAVKNKAHSKISLSLLDSEVITINSIKFSATEWEKLKALSEDRRGIPIPVKGTNNNIISLFINKLKPSRLF